MCGGKRRGLTRNLESGATNMTQTTETLEDRILTDRDSSFWLLDQLRNTANRDVLDALYDAQTLVKVLEERWAAELATEPDPTDERLWEGVEDVA